MTDTHPQRTAAAALPLTGAQAQGAHVTENRWLTVCRTLIFITNGPDVLLMKRALTKRIFPGAYNGIGGHLERDEDPYTGALREIREETGLTVRDLTLRGVSNIDAGGPTGIVLFVFTAAADVRAVTASHEGTLEWVPRDSDRLMQLPLVEDLPVLLPRLFGPSASPIPFFAHVAYDSDNRMVMRFAEP
jgi:8-oxo-dGTP diphosphatase